MIYTIKNPVKMGIYVNSKKKTLSAIQKELNATFICNLNLFDMNKFVGNCFTKANNAVVGNDGAVYPVLAFNEADKIMTHSWSNGCGSYANAFGCLDLIKDGKYCVSSVPSWASGYRERTAIGIKKDGTVVVYCDKTARSIAQVANALIKEGVVYAINVDGGGSTQCISPNGNVYSSRIVHTLFYVIEETKATDSNSDFIPTQTVRYGTTGQAALWVQQRLNKHGYNLVEDGKFYNKSRSALRDFQKNNGLYPDAIAGDKTKKVLAQ